MKPSKAIELLRMIENGGMGMLSQNTIDAALETAIFALEAQQTCKPECTPMYADVSDLISRQAAIDAASRTDYRGLTVEEVTCVTDAVVEELKRLPAAQPELPIKQKCTVCPHCDNCDVNDDGTSAQPEQRWIPVTERLPEDYQHVIVSGEKVVKQAQFIRGMFEMEDGEGYATINSDDIDEPYFYTFKAIAWMPLPEPYQEE